MKALLANSFLITFNSLQDRDLYIEHPAHKALSKEVGPFIADAVVFDYWANES